MPYKIYFENDPENASAPAQKVVITVPVDKNVNMYSFSLGDFGFGDFTFNIPPGKSFYTQRLNVTDSLGVLLDVNSGLDVTRNQAFWIFQSIDPKTGLPTTLPPEAGFLPVNDSITRRGEGFVNFSIKPRKNAQTGDTVKAFADIVFDTEKPLRTNIEQNIIDAYPPVSKIISTSFDPSSALYSLLFSGLDDHGGCGLNSFDLYVSRNHEPFYLSESDIKDPQYTFAGEYGNNYEFFTVAHDFVDNTESIKEKADTSVIMIPLQFFISPNSQNIVCAGSALVISWHNIGSAYINLQVSADSGRTFRNIESFIDASDTTFNWIINEDFSGDKFCLLRVVNSVSNMPLDTTEYFYISSKPKSYLNHEINGCTGEPVVLDAGEGYTHYLWSTGDTTNTIVVSQAGTYQVTITNNYACQTIDSTEVIVNALPTLDLGKDTLVNNQNSFIIIVPSNFKQYYWSTGDTAISYITVTQSGNYHLTVTDWNGCSATDSINVTFNNFQELVDLGNDTSFCQGDTLILDAESGFDSYLWNDGSTGQTLRVSATGEYHVTVTQNSMTGSDTIFVTVNDLPVVSFSGLDAQYCLDPPPVPPQLPPGIEYEPVPLIGTPSGGTFSGQGVAGNFFNPLTAGFGTHDITYTYTDQNGCSASQVQTVSIDKRPVVSFSGLNTQYCINADSVELTGTPAGGVFSGNGISGNSFNPDSAGIGIHQITYSYTYPNGCSANQVQSLTVNPLPDVSFTGLLEQYCFDLQVSPPPPPDLPGFPVIVTFPCSLLAGTPEGGTFSGDGMDSIVFCPSSAGAGTHTITYSYTDSNGCSASQDQMVTVTEPLAVSFSGLAEKYCINDDPVDLTGTPAGGTFYGRGISGNSFRPAIAGEGIHKITYYYTDTNGCSKGYEQLVTVNPIPDVSIIGMNDHYCAGAYSVLLHGTPEGGTFSGDGISGNTLYLDFDSISVGIHEITYSYTNSNGCSASYEQPVRIDPHPEVSFTGLATGYCLDADTVILTGTPDGGIFSGSGIAGNNFIPALAGPGIKRITYYYEDSNGCYARQVQTTFVKDLPVVSLSGLNAEYCINDDPVELDGTPEDGTFSGDGISDNSFSPAAAGIGTHQITYSYSDMFGCTASQVQYVTVNPLPEVSIIGMNDHYCAGAYSVLLHGTPEGGTFSGDGISGNTLYLDFDSISVGIHEITYSYTNSNGCSASYEQPVRIDPHPEVSFTGLATGYCLDADTVILTGTPDGGIFSGSGIAGNNFIPALAGPGIKRITYYYEDSNGCYARQVQTTFVKDLPVVSLSGLNAEYCINDDPVELTGTPEGGTFSGDGISGNSFSPAAAGIGTHQIRYTYTDPYGCSASQTQTVTVNALPEVSFTGLGKKYCFGGSMGGDLIGIPEGGTFSGKGIVDHFFFPVMSGTGTHQVSYSYIDSNGCSASHIQSVTVIEMPFVDIGSPSMEYCIDHEPVVCRGTPQGGDFWGDGISDNVFYPASLSAGRHAITYSYDDTSALGCYQEAKQIIHIYNLPDVSFTGLNPEYCINSDSVELTGTPEGGIFSGDGISGNSFSPVLAGIGVHQITYSYTDVNGCSASQTQTVTVNALPAVSFSGLDAEYCIAASPVELTGSPEDGTFTGDGITGNIFNPYAAGFGAHQISYFYTDTNGCSASYVQNVSVNGMPYVFIEGLNSGYCIDDGPVELTGIPEGGMFSGYGVTGNIFNPALAGEGFHQITYLYVDTGSIGCFGEAEKLTMVIGLPEVSFSGLNEQYCINDVPVELTGTPIEGTFSGDGISGNIFDPAVAGTGVHQITYTYTDPFGCSASQVQSVTINALPVVSFSGLNTQCYMNADTFALTGTPSEGVFSGNGILDNEFIPALAGLGTHEITYSYTDQNGCSNSQTQSVTVNELPMISFGSPESEYYVNDPGALNLELSYLNTTPPNCYNNCNGYASVNEPQIGGTPPYTYNWYKEYNNRYIEINNSNSNEITQLCTGKYRVNITDNENSSRLKYFYINCENSNRPKNSIDFAHENYMLVYPNPVKDILIIELHFMEETQGEINILNILGKRVMKVKQGNLNTEKIEVNISDLAGGIYYVQVNAENDILLERVVISNGR